MFFRLFSLDNRNKSERKNEAFAYLFSFARDALSRSRSQPPRVRLYACACICSLPVLPLILLWYASGCLASDIHSNIKSNVDKSNHAHRTHLRTRVHAVENRVRHRKCMSRAGVCIILALCVCVLYVWLFSLDLHTHTHESKLAVTTSSRA